MSIRLWALTLRMRDPEDPEGREIVLMARMTDNYVGTAQLHEEMHAILDEALDQILRQDRLLKVGEE